MKKAVGSGRTEYRYLKYLGLCMPWAERSSQIWNSIKSAHATCGALCLLEFAGAEDTELSVVHA